MNAIIQQRDIINRRTVMKNLGGLFKKDFSAAALRPNVLNVLREAFDDGHKEIKDRFTTSGKSDSVIAPNAFLIDQIIRIIFDLTTSYIYPSSSHSDSEKISIVAIGGYGRLELAPHSDVDIMFLLPYKQNAYVEQIIEYILYMLWDLGLNIGHSTRSVSDCVRLSKQDTIIQTSLLDSRWLWGNQRLFSEFLIRFQQDVVEKNSRQFISAKLLERKQRHERIGDSRYILEPNIKEGKGGLRDLQTLYWLSKHTHSISNVSELVGLNVFTKQESLRFKKAFNFLWTVRCHLHYLTDRPEERLSFDLQESVGRLMQYNDRPGIRGVERFMKHYFLTAKTVGELTQLLCTILDEKQNRLINWKLPLFNKKPLSIEGFYKENGNLIIDNPSVFKDTPLNLLLVFLASQENGLEIHPKTMRFISQNLSLINSEFRKKPEANAIFLDILTYPKNPENTLRILSEAGVLGKFIPAFGKIVGQMEFSMYHSYTVDEHTIRAIGILSSIEAGDFSAEMPNVTQAIGKINSRRALYFALFLHDICKGKKGDHSTLGASLALKLCPRLGLNQEETDTVSWLVKEHLTMSDTAFKRDLEDQNTVRTFANIVKSIERLKLLTILTCADIRAVGPKTWNNWKSGLLRELYHKTLEAISGDQITENRAERILFVKDKLRKHFDRWPREFLENHLTAGFSSYWLNCDHATLIWHAEIVKKAHDKNLPFWVESKINHVFNYAEVTVYAPDQPGLFSDISGVMALTNVNIVGAKISTRSDGMVLDTFAFLDASNQPTTEQNKINRLILALEDLLSGQFNVSERFRGAKKINKNKKPKPFNVASRVLFDNNASSTNTVLEINGRDRMGLLYELTKALTDLGLKISSAHITTFGVEVVDTFYIKDSFGLKVTHHKKQKKIREELIRIVNSK